jgi:hypothetical protein
MNPRFLLLVFMAIGCTRARITLGRPVLPADAAAIVHGLSKAAVLGRLGPPDHVENEPRGSAFEYLYSHTAERGLDVKLFQASFSYDEARIRVERLRVSFDADGKVRHVGVVLPDAGQ